MFLFIIILVVSLLNPSSYFSKRSQLAEAQLAAELEHEEALRRGVKQRRRSSIRSPTSPTSPNSSEPSSAKRRGSVLSPGSSKKEPLSPGRRESLSPLRGISREPLSPSRRESLSPLRGSSREPLSPSSPLNGLQEEAAEAAAAAATPSSSPNPRGRAAAPKVVRSASERAAGLPVALLRQESVASSGGAASPTRGSAAAVHRGSSSSRDRRGSQSPSKQPQGSLSPSSSSLSPLRRRNTIANNSPSPSRQSRGGSGRGGSLGTSPAAARGSRSRRWSIRGSLNDNDYDDDNASAGKVDEESDVSDEEMAWDRTRIWGAWEAVHPAALGRKSQREAFPWHDPIRFEGGTGDDKKYSHLAAVVNV